MSVSSSRLLASASAVALVIASLASSEATARNSTRSRNAVVEEIAPMSQDTANDIIYEMPPLKPVRNSAVAAKPAPAKAATAAKPAEPAKPAIAAEPAKPAEPAAVAQTPAQPATAAPPTQNAGAPAVAAATPPAAEAQAPATEVQQSGPDVSAPTVKATDAQPAAPPSEGSPPQVAETAPENASQGKAPETAGPPPAPPAEAAQTPAVTPTEPPQVADAPAAAAPAAATAATPPSAGPADAQAPVAAAPVADNSVPAPPTAQEPASSEPAPADLAEAPADAYARIAALINAGVKGPAEVRVADRATIWLPAGRVFVPGESALKLAKEAGLELRPGAQGVIAPADDKLSWLAPVELLEDGFIKTGEADALQAEKILAAFQAGLPEVNANRAKSGQPPVSLAGWLTPPALDDKHRLSACVNVKTEGGAAGGDNFFNCEAWALGRQGAIKISLAEGGEQAEKTKGEALALAETIVYDHGKAYEDIEVAADKPAPYAAADLLTSDVSARATTAQVSGAGEEGGVSPAVLVAKLWKIILFAVIAIGGVIAWFRRRSARSDSMPVSAGAPMQFEEDAGESDQDAEAPASLFERTLPTLHARFAKTKAAPQAASARSAARAGVDAISSRVSRDDELSAEQPASGGPLGKISAMRSGARAGATEPETRARAMSSEEPASALKKLASRMRGAPEAPPAPVDVARVIRAARSLPGAAPAPADFAPTSDEPILMAPAPSLGPEINELGRDAEPEAAAPPPPRATATPPQSPAAAAPAPRLEEDVDADAFGGLVEPGDEAATSAVMHAREALRHASA